MISVGSNVATGEGPPSAEHESCGRDGLFPTVLDREVKVAFDGGVVVLLLERQIEVQAHEPNQLYDPVERWGRGPPLHPRDGGLRRTCELGKLRLTESPSEPATPDRLPGKGGRVARH
jgi:hypothetical protein